MERFAGIPIPSKTNPRHDALVVARIIWLAGFALLLVLVVASLINGGALRDLAGQWLVGQGLPAAAAFLPTDTFFVYLLTLRSVVLAVTWLVALLVFWRQPDDSVALLVSWSLLLMPFSLVIGGDDAPWRTLLSFLGLALFLLLLFVFPDGRLLPQTNKNRILLILIILLTPILSFILLSVFLPQYSPEDLAYGAFIFMLAAIMLSGVASQVFRYRQAADPGQRQQTRWVLFGLSSQLLWISWWLLSITGLLEALGVSHSTQSLIGLHINIFVPLLLPLTFGVAMLRHGLWSGTPLINRALVYGILSIIIISLYILIIGGFGLLFQSSGSLLIALIATGIVAVIFQPLQNRLQRSVNKLMYGERDDPLGMLAELSSQLEGANSVEAIMPVLVETIAGALRLPYVAVTLHAEGDQNKKLAASIGTRPTQIELFLLRYETEELGQLIVAPRAPRHELAASDQRLLATIAVLLTTTIKVLQLNDQLRDSRQRLVTVQEEERRRIRRDLHDGLGPVLASLTLQIDTAADLVPNEPDEAVAILMKMRQKAQGAVVEIRQLIHDLRPPALDELGLEGAIRQYGSTLALNGLNFTVRESDSLLELPAALEVAAYRIAQEAINNVALHAQATSCRVSINVKDDLILEVIDDGVGMQENGNLGIGLGSMKERAAELGGICTAERNPSGGTRVIARLPIGNPIS